MVLSIDWHPVRRGMHVPNLICKPYKNFHIAVGIWKQVLSLVVITSILQFQRCITNILICFVLNFYATVRMLMWQAFQLMLMWQVFLLLLSMIPYRRFRMTRSLLEEMQTSMQTRVALMSFCQTVNLMIQVTWLKWLEGKTVVCYLSTVHKCIHYFMYLWVDEAA